jgi:hypothetical protein
MCPNTISEEILELVGIAAAANKLTIRVCFDIENNKNRRRRRRRASRAF